jgi:hypothetical protein
MKNYKKDFKYTIKTKEGKIIAQAVISFGSEECPFPKDWAENGMVLRSLHEYKDVFINSFLDISFEEGNELDDFPKDIKFDYKEYQKNDDLKETNNNIE